MSKTTTNKREPRTNKKVGTRADTRTRQPPRTATPRPSRTTGLVPRAKTPAPSDREEEPSLPRVEGEGEGADQVDDGNEGADRVGEDRGEDPSGDRRDAGGDEDRGDDERESQATARLGTNLRAHLEVFHMAERDAAIDLIDRIIPVDEDLDHLAQDLEILGSDVLARDVRLLVDRRRRAAETSR